MNITSILTNMTLAAIVIAFMYVAKKIADARTVNIDDDYEVEENSNLAIAIRRAGLYLGGMIAIMGVLVGSSKGFVMDIMNVSIYSALAYACLFTARELNDKIILRGINNDDECKNGNTAVAIVEFGSYIATGLIINACVSGDSVGLMKGVTDTLIFFAMGQVILIALAVAYESITKFHCLAEIHKGNAAAGIMVSGKLIALGFILKNSIIGESAGWTADLISFGQAAIFGTIILLVFNAAIDHLFLPNTNVHKEVVEDQNVAATVVTQAVTIGFALIITTIV